MRVWRILSRVATVAGIVGGLLFLLLLVSSLLVFMPGGARGRGSSSIDHEPMAFETAKELIGSGGIYMVAIRRDGNMDEYFLYEEGTEYDPQAEPSQRWKVDGMDVHVFTDNMPTGTPLTSNDDPDKVGITSDELTDLLQRLDRFNAGSPWQIKIYDHREQ